VIFEHSEIYSILAPSSVAPMGASQLWLKIYEALSSTHGMWKF